ncbi:TonB-dependent receptor [Porphyrobacter algicida]|uniref:TonB-dependent receptor n=1 Tax=Qipengyuania algicida TaxID=1836209 RepID=A0A845AFJ1_9SPHN|nr:TonB-dependent receptor [Qipengyuania algicida]MXP27565.1 TonB-dependent receptor [Qipengyuania algicida]
MKHPTLLKASVAPLALGLALASVPAFAQDTTTDAQATSQSSSDAAPPAPAADSGSTIIVTGSRIPQPNIEGASPVTVLNSQDIKLQGTTRIEDLTNSLPQVFAGQASTLSNGASGTATVDLRGLGASRTLVLVNGRRLMPGDPNDSAADLNAIPAGLVKRVEVLTGGASSTYGADAVAGVVNFIMDTDFSGIRLDGQYSFYQHNNHNDFIRPLLDARQAQGLSGYGYPEGSVADGGTIDTTLTIGTGFDDNRGHVTAYVGYRKANPVIQARRDYSACTIQNTSSGANQCGGSATSANGNVLLYDPTTGNTTSSTIYTIRPNGGFENGLTRYNFAPSNYFQRPDERYTAGFFAHYDINDAIRPYAEFMFMDDRSVAQIAPSGDFGNTLTVNCDNPLLSATQKSVVCATPNLVNGYLGNFPLTGMLNPGPAPLTFTDPTTGQTYNRAFFQLLKRNVEGGYRAADFEHTQYRGVIGVKGDLNPAFSYDAYYQYGRTVYTQVYTNELSIARLNKATDVVTDPSTGNPVCRSALDQSDPSCVPYDVFGGNITSDALNYVAASGFQKGIVSEQVANASITGQLGQYGIQSPWAADGLGVNVGVEYRKESLDLQVDHAFETGDLTGQGAATLPVSGNYHTVDFFGEAQLPIVQDSFIKLLSVNAGYRHSNYDTSNGKTYATDTYKFGVEFAPIRDIRFRASYNRAVRVPNIQELFAPQLVALDGSTDPCSGFKITAANVGCIAQGLSIGQQVAPNPAQQYNGFIGGNPDLVPEVATTKSLGVVLQPSFLPGFAASVDYYDIKIENAIQGFGADAILKSCTTDVNPVACALIHRNPVSGSLWLTPDGFVTDINSNVGSIQTKGIDVNASYTTSVGSLGSISASIVGTYIDKFIVDNGLTAPYDCAGYYGGTCGGLTTIPSAPTAKWRHKARLTWDMPSGIGLSLQWRYFGPVSVDSSSSNSTLNGNPGNPGVHIAGQSWFDLAGSFKMGDHYTFRIGVNNIFDKDPPLISSGGSGYDSSCPTGPCNGNTYPAVYDSLGRYIFAGVTLDF